MDPWHKLERIAAEQHGVVAKAQVEQLGLCWRTAVRRVTRLGGHMPHPGVLVLPATNPTYLQRCCAAVRAAGSGALVAELSAVNVWQLLDVRPTPVRLVVPAERGAPRLRDVATTRSRTLHEQDATVRWGVPVTTVPRTIADLAGAVGIPMLAEIAAVAVQRRLVTLDEIATHAAARSNLRGGRNLRQVLDDLRRQGRTDSGFERRVRRRLIAVNLPPHPGVYPLVCAGGLVAMLDIAYPPARVTLEADGLRWHSSPRQLADDHRRDRGIRRAGWHLERISRYEFDHHFDEFVAGFRALLLSRGWTPPAV